MPLSFKWNKMYKEERRLLLPRYLSCGSHLHLCSPSRRQWPRTRPYYPPPSFLSWCCWWARTHAQSLVSSIKRKPSTAEISSWWCPRPIGSFYMGCVMKLCYNIHTVCLKNSTLKISHYAAIQRAGLMVYKLFKTAVLTARGESPDHK